MWPIMLIEIAINLSQGGGAEPPAVPPCKPTAQAEAPACASAAPARPGELRSAPRAASAAPQ